MSEPAVHPYSSHAPVFTVAGRTEGRLGRDLLRLDIQEGSLGLRTLVAHLDPVGPDSDGSAESLSYLDGGLLDFGTELTATLGPAGGERQLFKGVVSGLEVSFAEGGTPYVTVFAEDALMKLRLTHTTTSYENRTDAQLAEAVADRHGLGSVADADGPAYPLVQQWDQSDLAFLRERALRVAAELWVDSDDTLHFTTRDKREGADLRLVQGNELVELHARADLAHQRADVQLLGWDDDTAAKVVETAGADLVSAETGGGRTGPSIVAQVYRGPRLTRSRRDTPVAGTATAYAAAELLRRARGFVTVEGTTAGTPDLVPGAHLDLRRVGRPFEGDGYRVVHARHSYDPSIGYRTAFRAERPEVRS
ncbi:phage late control D family protein [Actinopolymorpha singaporensis]|uniref:Phage protein D n=1 Tax=Actinopolymorpha singaporensis TaxID=117157 RepID=A0A1H1UYR4_9ACTN|nr:contractile injection system protein, VgrG/Pvc8 family [Actinopolymorpha singaporensis]SDS77625.1 Phage protein D [Actinopolymorpha singaporensis]